MLCLLEKCVRAYDAARVRADILLGYTYENDAQKRRIIRIIVRILYICLVRDYGNYRWYYNNTIRDDIPTDVVLSYANRSHGPL